jgi:phage terminase large subunit-like protein
VARPTKTLQEHLRDGSFRADRHGGLLLGPLVDDPELAGLQTTYRSAASTDEQRLIAIAFAQESKLVEGRKPRPTLNGCDGAAVADFFAAHFVHTKGRAAGRPFELEDWQRAFVDEFYKHDEEGRRIYRLGVLGVPRGNGKSPLAAGLGLYELLTRGDSPDVFCAAGSREQARIVFNFARSFVETGPLLDVVRVGRNELIYPDGTGSMRVVSADGSLQFGHSVSCAIVDEAHVFATQKHQDLWEAFETALHKRLDSFLLAITTAGSDRTSLLGRLVESSLAQLSLERPCSGLTVGRDEENGVLLWWYAAPDTAELDDEATWRAANPASWVDLRDLRRQRNSPGTSESAFRRLHLNQWTHAEDVWITPARWAACRSEEEIPEGAEVFVGVDASFSGDATAVAWSWRNDEGTILVRAHIWSALKETPAHVHVAGGHINLEAVEDFVTALGQRYRIREAVYDPAFFARSAEILSARGLVVASLDQRSAPMREAWSQFYEAVNSGALAHAGDPILTAHVLNAAAHVDPAGHWKVRKIKQSHKIDGLVASVIAYSRAARAPAKRSIAFAWA